MQLKWILAIIITVIIVGVSGSKFLDYKRKTEQIDVFLNSYGSSFAVTYDDVKMTSLRSDVFNIKNLSITSNNLSVQSSNASMNINDMASGKFSLQDVNFKYFDLNGSAASVHVHDLQINNKDKDISITLDGLTLNRKGNLIENGNMTAQIKQTYDNLEVISNITTLEGDNVSGSLKATLDKGSVNDSKIYTSILKGKVDEFKVNLNNVSVFNKLAKEYPSLKTEMNDYAVKFVQHHYPKAHKSGLDVMEFLKEQKTLKLSVTPTADLSPGDFLHLKGVDSLTIFEALNLEVSK